VGVKKHPAGIMNELILQNRGKNERFLIVFGLNLINHFVVGREWFINGLLISALSLNVITGGKVIIIG
jgi:hypothetical protein